MRIEEDKMVTKIEKVTTGIKCDSCGKIHIGESTPKDWHFFSSSHGGWGNDSFDSFEYHHVCSAECYISLLEECIKRVGGYRDNEIAEMHSSFAKKLVEKFKQIQS